MTMFVDLLYVCVAVMKKQCFLGPEPAPRKLTLLSPSYGPVKRRNEKNKKKDAAAHPYIVLEGGTRKNELVVGGDRVWERGIFNRIMRLLLRRSDTVQCALPTDTSDICKRHKAALDALVKDRYHTHDCTVDHEMHSVEFAPPWVGDVVSYPEHAWYRRSKKRDEHCVLNQAAEYSGDSSRTTVGSPAMYSDCPGFSTCLGKRLDCGHFPRLLNTIVWNRYVNTASRRDAVFAYVLEIWVDYYALGPKHPEATSYSSWSFSPRRISQKRNVLNTLLPEHGLVFTACPSCEERGIRYLIRDCIDHVNILPVRVLRLLINLLRLPDDRPGTGPGTIITDYMFAFQERCVATVDNLDPCVYPGDCVEEPMEESLASSGEEEDD